MNDDAEVLRRAWCSTCSKPGKHLAEVVPTAGSPFPRQKAAIYVLRGCSGVQCVANRNGNKEKAVKDTEQNRRHSSATSPIHAPSNLKNFAIYQAIMVQIWPGFSPSGPRWEAKTAKKGKIGRWNPTNQCAIFQPGHRLTPFKFFRSIVMGPSSGPILAGIQPVRAELESENGKKGQNWQVEPYKSVCQFPARPPIDLIQ
eukprot:1155658-Pelagomonas_calceolata.AAC.1